MVDNSYSLAGFAFNSKGGYWTNDFASSHSGTEQFSVNCKAPYSPPPPTTTKALVIKTTSTKPSSTAVKTTPVVIQPKILTISKPATTTKTTTTTKDVIPTTEAVAPKAKPATIEAETTKDAITTTDVVTPKAKPVTTETETTTTEAAVTKNAAIAKVKTTTTTEAATTTEARRVGGPGTTTDAAPTAASPPVVLPVIAIVVNGDGKPINTETFLTTIIPDPTGTAEPVAIATACVNQFADPMECPSDLVVVDGVAVFSTSSPSIPVVTATVIVPS
jgi:hypothetical protein